MKYSLYLFAIWVLALLLFPSGGYETPLARSILGASVITLIIGLFTWSRF